ncbi:hypothetical protein IKE67_02555 [bacterium]|nr:hypothetical protein [bacterium]
MFLTKEDEINLKKVYSTYQNDRKGFLYYDVIRIILKFLSGKNLSIIDVGSCGIDLISDLDFKQRVSVDIEYPICSENVTGVKKDFFDYKEPHKFDIITCFQVIEHIENAKEFTQKLLNTANLAIISLPYKWPQEQCVYHCQDPVDEKKLYSWTNKRPLFTFYVGGIYNDDRFINIYGNTKYLFKNWFDLFLLSIKYSKFSLHNNFMKSLCENIEKLNILIQINI